MKKAKIMLSVIVVLAVVGGALAFKAKNYGSATLCYNASNHLVCDLKAVLSTVTPGNVNAYTLTSDLANCGRLACPNLGILRGM